MSHVIYNKETTIILKSRARSVGMWISHYQTEAAAKAALTRMTKAGKLEEGCTKDDYAIAEAREFYHNIELKTTLNNLMSGEPFEVGVNTPFTSTPASETYWCS